MPSAGMPYGEIGLDDSGLQIRFSPGIAGAPVPALGAGAGAPTSGGIPAGGGSVPLRRPPVLRLAAPRWVRGYPWRAQLVAFLYPVLPNPGHGWSGKRKRRCRAECERKQGGNRQARKN
jgi:hypothetical protein